MEFEIYLVLCIIVCFLVFSKLNFFVGLMGEMFLTPLCFCCCDHSLVSSVTIRDAALIQFVLLMMSTVLLETCRGM